MPLAKMPEPPYYAVIFTSKRTKGDDIAYDRMAEKMAGLAAKQPGYLGIESARSADGTGITISYWQDEAAIKNWKQVTTHMTAQKLGREQWYETYEVRIAKVERAYEFVRQEH